MWNELIHYIATKEFDVIPKGLSSSMEVPMGSTAADALRLVIYYVYKLIGKGQDKTNGPKKNTTKDMVWKNMEKESAIRTIELD